MISSPLPSNMRGGTFPPVKSKYYKISILNRQPSFFIDRSEEEKGTLTKKSALQNLK
jgi:hypothetical protein